MSDGHGIGIAQTASITGVKMHRYQIRLPENMTLQDLVADMTIKAWMMIHRHFDLTTRVDHAQSDFQNRIICILTERVKAFDMCGAIDVCTESVENRPLSNEKELNVQSEDRICHLVVQEELDEFLDNLALKGMDSIKEILRPESEMEVFHILQMVFRLALEDYVYFNPECGHAKICDSSEEINPWEPIERKLIN